MLWQAQHGATAERYRKEQEAKGAPIPTYLFPPDILPGLGAWLEAFWELSTERRFSGGPIPASSIRAYPVSPDEKSVFQEVMRSTDKAYLEFLAKPREERESLPVATSGLFKRKQKNHGRSQPRHTGRQQVGLGGRHGPGPTDSSSG